MKIIFVFFVIVIGCTVGVPFKGTDNSPRFPIGDGLAETCKDVEKALPKAKRPSAKFRIDEKTGKCHVVDEKGPCGSNMIFAELEKNETYGICDCDRKGERFQIYDEGTNQCYFVFDKAYCDEGQRLSVTKDEEDKKPICEPNPCSRISKYNPDIFYIYLDEEYECQELGVQGDSCEPGEVLDFKSGFIPPLCLKLDSAPTNEFSCLPGTSKSVPGRCLKNVKWPKKQ